MFRARTLDALSHSTHADDPTEAGYMWWLLAMSSDEE